MVCVVLEPLSRTVAVAPFAHAAAVCWPCGFCLLCLLKDVVERNTAGCETTEESEGLCGALCPLEPVPLPRGDSHTRARGCAVGLRISPSPEVLCGHVTRAWLMEPREATAASGSGPKR